MIALRVINLHVSEPPQYCLILDKFGNRLQAYHMTDMINGIHHGGHQFIINHITHEAAIDLDVVQRQISEIGIGTHTGSKIIQGKAAAPATHILDEIDLLERSWYAVKAQDLDKDSNELTTDEKFSHRYAMGDWEDRDQRIVETALAVSLGETGGEE